MKIVECLWLEVNNDNQQNKNDQASLMILEDSPDKLLQREGRIYGKWTK